MERQAGEAPCVAGARVQALPTHIPELGGAICRCSCKGEFLGASRLARSVRHECLWMPADVCAPLFMRLHHTALSDLPQFASKATQLCTASVHNCSVFTCMMLYGKYIYTCSVLTCVMLFLSLIHI